MPHEDIVSLRERVEAIREEEIPQLEARLEVAEAAVQNQMGPNQEFWKVDADALAAKEQTEDDLADARGEAKKYERFIEEFAGEDADDAVWKLRELTGEEMATISNEVVANSDIKMDAKTEQASMSPEPMTAEIQKLEKAIQSAPENAPEKPTGDPAPGDYPASLQHFLLDCYDDLKAVGEIDLGNTSYGVDLTSSGE